MEEGGEGEVRKERRKWGRERDKEDREKSESRKGRKKGEREREMENDMRFEKRKWRVEVERCEKGERVETVIKELRGSGEEV